MAWCAETTTHRCRSKVTFTSFELMFYRLDNEISTMARERRPKPDERGRVLPAESFRAGFLRWWLETLVEKRSIDVARADRARAHAVTTFLGVDLLREAAQPEFRRDVGWSGQIAGNLADIGVDVDDRAGPPRSHAWQKCTDAVSARHCADTRQSSSDTTQSSAAYVHARGG